jgi:hypothetical protein
MDQGSHYQKCDLQVHSPRDRGWKGSDCVTEEEWEAYEVLASRIRIMGFKLIVLKIDW